MATPKIANVSITTLAATSATFSGQIVIDMAQPLLECGVVFAPTSVNRNPKIHGEGVESRQSTTFDTTTGDFQASATNLEPGKEYAFAVYATNAPGPDGTTYSPLFTFTTLPAPSSSSRTRPGNPDRGFEVLRVWVESSASAVKSFFPSVASLMKDFFQGLSAILKGLAAMSTIVFIAEVALVAIVTAYMAKTWANDRDDFARGLITVLFSTGTIAIAFILTITAIFSNPANPGSKEQFDRGKEVFTVMIGIFGTIMGFYFGSVQTTPVADNVKFSLAGPKSETVTLDKGASKTIAITLNLRQTGVKFGGSVKFSLETLPMGFSNPEFAPQQIDSGAVTFKVTVDDTAKAGSHSLRIIGTPDSETISPVEHKITVVVVKNEPAKALQKGG
jgi:hypothetical protein